jgi:hypothetical protein
MKRPSRFGEPCARPIIRRFVKSRGVAASCFATARRARSRVYVTLFAMGRFDYTYDHEKNPMEGDEDTSIRDSLGVCRSEKSDADLLRLEIPLCENADARLRLPGRL